MPLAMTTRQYAPSGTQLGTVNEQVCTIVPVCRPIVE